MRATTPLRWWLWLQAAALGGLAFMFGILFPIGGVVLWLLQLSPSGEDPLGPALAMGIAGPLTALFYLPGALLTAWAARRYATDPDTALIPVLVACGAGSIACGILVVVPVVLIVMEQGGEKTEP